MTTVSKPVTDLSDTRHVFTWKDMHLAITLERFQEERSGLKCEITIVDTESGEKLIPTGNFNLSSAIGRKNTTNRLKARTPDEDIDWDLYLDYVTNISQSRYRTGDSVVELMSVPVAERPRFLLQPFVENDGVTLLYGDGGCGKSLLALAMAMSVASGVPILGMTPTRVVPVLYLDWESAANDHAERARAIHAGTGTDLDPPMFIHYQRQVASLAEGAPNIWRAGAGPSRSDRMSPPRTSTPSSWPCKSTTTRAPAPRNASPITSVSRPRRAPSANSTLTRSPSALKNGTTPCRRRTQSIGCRNGTKYATPCGRRATHSRYSTFVTGSLQKE